MQVFMCECVTSILLSADSDVSVWLRVIAETLTPIELGQLMHHLPLVAEHGRETVPTDLVT